MATDFACLPASARLPAEVSMLPHPEILSSSHHPDLT